MDQQPDPAQQPKTFRKKGKGKGKGKGKRETAVADKPTQQEGSSREEGEQTPARVSRCRRSRALRAAQALEEKSMAASAAKIDKLKEMDEESRQAAMILATMSDLGSERAKHIRTVQKERHVAANIAELTASRRSNQKGSEEAKWAREEESAKALTSWNNFVGSKNPNAEPDDGTAGQSHRARMVAGLHPAGIGHHTGPSSRGGRAGHGGRGGGGAGSGISRAVHFNLQDRSVKPPNQNNVRGGMTGSSLRLDLQSKIHQGLRRMGDRDRQLADAKALLKSFTSAKNTKKTSSAQNTTSAPKKLRQEGKPAKVFIPPPRLVDSEAFVKNYQNTSGLGHKGNEKPNTGLGNSSFAPVAPMPATNIGKENQPLLQLAVPPSKSTDEKSGNDDVFGRGSDYISITDLADKFSKVSVTAAPVQKVETTTQAVDTPVSLFDVKPAAVQQITPDLAPFFDIEPDVAALPVQKVETTTKAVDTPVHLFDVEPIAVQQVIPDPAPFFKVESAVAAEAPKPVLAPLVSSWATVLQHELKGHKVEAPRRKTSSHNGSVSSHDRVSWHPVGPRPIPAGLKFLQGGYDARKPAKESNKAKHPVPAGLQFLQAGSDTNKIDKENVMPKSLEMVPASPVASLPTPISEMTPEEGEDAYSFMQRRVEAQLLREGLLTSAEEEDEYEAKLREIVAELTAEGFLGDDAMSVDAKSETAESSDTEL